MRLRTDVVYIVEQLRLASKALCYELIVCLLFA
uniref:Uncharacterized protein n=1 Tax=Anguilla anguilla TaxID=7936 RepID=A0A0E9Q9W3_ANGAN